MPVVPGGSGTPPGGSGGPGTPAGGGPEDDPGAPAAAGPIGGDSTLNLIVLCATVSTGVSLVGAFLLFGRRRRREGDPEPGDLAPATVAAGPFRPPPLNQPPPLIPAPSPQPSFDPGTGGTDVDLPRWRRPSLMAARKSDPVRTAATAGSITFAANQAAADGGERHRVRYRLVRLLDRPDEIVGATVGSLDEGDEVEVLEKHGLYRRVTTPDGRSGWLHKMTLGDLVEGAEPEADIEQDVLIAYLSGRAKG